jgi:hypothetical protein
MSYLFTILNTIYLSIGLKLLDIIPLSFLFLYLQQYGIKYYHLTKTEECKIIQKHISKFCSQQNGNEKGSGYSYGYWYILNLTISSGDSDMYNIYMIASEESYQNLIKESNTSKYNLLSNDEETNMIGQSKITVYDRLGSFHNPWFRKRSNEITITPRNNQQIILDKIVKYHDENKHTVVFLHGSPGSGKSMIGQFLTNHYNGSYCDELIPWQPGDTLGGLYTEAEPTEDKPLIIAFDEIDNILLKIHNNEIESHKNLPIQIKNKETWNKFFDAIDRHKYKHIIIIMTSNRSNEFINELDSSYLREGRVNLIFELVKDNIDT